jgi:putative flippase GtrA
MKTIPVRLALRWLKFYAVGAVGLGLQLGVLKILAGIFELNCLVATAVAVEAAILHNFLWHERWTWQDRTRGWRTPRSVVLRLVRFHIGAGLLPLLWNLVLMALLVGKLNYLLANLLAICSCCWVNFLICDRVVFKGVAGSDLADAARLRRSLCNRAIADPADRS